AVATCPVLWIERIRPEQGSAAFQATASCCVCNVRTLLPWITSAPFANRLPAVLLSPWLSASLHARTTLSAEGEPVPPPAATARSARRTAVLLTPGPPARAPGSARAAAHSPAAVGRRRAIPSVFRAAPTRRARGLRVRPGRRRRAIP